MRKLVINEQLTLDGVMQAPGDPDEDRSGGFEHGGWFRSYFAEDLFRIIGESLPETDAFLFGRRTYEIMARYWPYAPEGEPFTHIMNNTPKYVASTTLAEPLEWKGSTLLQGPVPDAVAALKREPGKHIVVLGSGELARTLSEHDLVDEYGIMITPLLLGGGKRLFDHGGRKRPLRLVDSKVTSTGVIYASYEPGR